MADRLRWRWRNVPIPEPHLGLLAGGLILQRARPKPLSPVGRIRCVAGWCCTASGIALAAWATGATAELDLEHPDRLVTLGPYATSRNPMYVGWTGIYLGMALAANTRWLILLSPMLLALVHFTTVAEERELENRWGMSSPHSHCCLCLAGLALSHI
jgi:protein-S-isoprenylcysteine O-methyltransferase Ste14